jgi:hypothetical protein
MRKLVMTVIMVLGMVAGASANSVSILDRINGDGRNYDFNINEKRLGEYLELKDSVEFHDMFGGFREGMAFAGSVENDGSRRRIVVNSIAHTVEGAAMVLDRGQYKRFMTVLNVTLQNRGFRPELGMYMAEKQK